jgi:hypothetical protein
MTEHKYKMLFRNKSIFSPDVTGVKTLTDSPLDDLTGFDFFTRGTQRQPAKSLLAASSLYNPGLKSNASSLFQPYDDGDIYQYRTLRSEELPPFDEQWILSCGDYSSCKSEGKLQGKVCEIFDPSPCLRPEFMKNNLLSCAPYSELLCLSDKNFASQNPALCQIDCKYTYTNDSDTCELVNGQWVRKQTINITQQPIGDRAWPCPSSTRTIPCDLTPVDCAFTSSLGNTCQQGPCFGLTGATSQACFNEIWKSAGCITPAPVVASQKTVAELKATSAALAASTTVTDRTACYSADRSRWPGGISYMPPSDSTSSYIQNRTFSVTQQSRNGGKQCPISLTDIVNCTLNKDCQVTWNLSSTCTRDSSGQLVQVQNATVNQSTLYGGAPCPSPMTRTIPCGLPINCTGTYSTTCQQKADGKWYRNFIASQTALNGGSVCPPDILCAPINCTGTFVNSPNATCTRDSTTGKYFISQSFAPTTTAMYGGAQCPVPSKRECTTAETCRSDKAFLLANGALCRASGVEPCQQLDYRTDCSRAQECKDRNYNPCFDQVFYCKQCSDTICPYDLVRETTQQGVDPCLLCSDYIGSSYVKNNLSKCCATNNPTYGFGAAYDGSMEKLCLEAGVDLCKENRLYNTLKCQPPPITTSTQPDYTYTYGSNPGMMTSDWT